MSELSKKQLRRQRRQEERESERRGQKRSNVGHRLLLWGGVVVGLAVVVFVIVKLVHSAPVQPSEILSNSQVSSSDWIRGNASSSVTLIEYADFQCPACKAYEPYVEQLVQDLGTQFRLVYRYFPLTTIHPNALLAAQAAQAAGMQGKFWQMHDLLYQDQDTWAPLGDPTQTFVGYAQQLGLNTTQFSQDLNSSAVKARVQVDIDSGNAAGVDATPTFFLNGTQIQNPSTYAEFEADITQAASSSQP